MFRVVKVRNRVKAGLIAPTRKSSHYIRALKAHCSPVVWKSCPAEILAGIVLHAMQNDGHLLTPTGHIQAMIAVEDMAYHTAATRIMQTLKRKN